jgi:hypothetical protein
MHSGICRQYSKWQALRIPRSEVPFPVFRRGGFFLERFSPGVAASAVEAIIKAISNVYILTIVVGALALSRFLLMKKGKANPAADGGLEGWLDNQIPRLMPQEG